METKFAFRHVRLHESCATQSIKIRSFKVQMPGESDAAHQAHCRASLMDTNIHTLDTFTSDPVHCSKAC